MPNEQQENITRVSEVVGPLVLEFYRLTLGTGHPWHMEELTAYVSERTSIAPDSAGRILRALRQRGMLSYRVLSRSESLYESLPMRKSPASVHSLPEEQHGS